MPEYRVRDDFVIDAGFEVTGEHVGAAAERTNAILGDLPSSLYKSLDYKTVSAMVGAIFCEELAAQTNSMVNPIEKGHPDIIPLAGANSTEAQLRNYPEGLEVKCTVGNIETGGNLRAGQVRIGQLVGITWQAHHREVRELMGLIWDFANERPSFRFPAITGVFFADDLIEDDWGTISGTTGRNTKVSGMRTSGKSKMAQGWVLLWDEEEYLGTYQRLLGIPL